MNGKRLTREKKTIVAMVKIYCKGNHSPQNADVCAECQEFIQYALKRLDKCPFQEGKPTCGKCTVHCYKPDRREQVKVIMRYAGPKMILSHPILAIQHTFDGLSRQK